jgi:hypothetical protein
LAPKTFALLSVLIFSTFAFSALAFAEGTRTWEQSKFDELTKGTATGIALRSQGGLELAPAFKSLATTPSTYIWSIASDSAGNIYAAAGSPARVYRITPDGQTTTIFEPQELQVQSLVVASKDVVYAATAPDGKVYRLEAAKGAKPDAKASWNATPYFDPKSKYIWDLALDTAGNLYVATGDHGEIFKVAANGQHSLFFKSDEVHIRVLALDPKGNLIAGSDGSGLIYRVAPNGEAFVLYSAPKKEITALAIDNAGNIYAAAAGEKHPASNASHEGLTLSPPSQGATVPISGGNITITAPPVGPTSPFPAPGTGATGGSEIYRIAPDGAPSHLWSSHEDLVYALAFDQQGRLVAGTGNRGHIFAINGVDDYTDLIKASATQITGFAAAPGGGLYASGSNLGKIFVLGPGPESEGSYESDVFDAHIFSHWGSASVRISGNSASHVEFYARSGNVDNPDRNWSKWTRINLAPDVSELNVPPARFVQWKAVLRAANPAPLVDDVLLYYLPQNVAPEIDDIAVQPGYRYQPIPHVTGSEPQSPGQPRFDPPPPAIRDRDSIGIRWSAHDDNDDQLVYAVYYRGDGESRWLLLKKDLSDRSYSFDAALLPDGGYTVKVIASDAPSHSPGEALYVERVSSRFEVDSTAPVIDNLKATLESDKQNAGEIHVYFRATDSFSPIKRAEYSVDGGDWQFVEPVGQLSDSKTESYDFRVTVPQSASAPPMMEHDTANDHVVVVRAYDRFDNQATAKTVLRGK